MLFVSIRFQRIGQRKWKINLMITDGNTMTSRREKDFPTVIRYVLSKREPPTRKGGDTGTEGAHGLTTLTVSGRRGGHRVKGLLHSRLVWDDGRDVHDRNAVARLTGIQRRMQVGGRTM